MALAFYGLELMTFNMANPGTVRPGPFGSPEFAAEVHTLLLGVAFFHDLACGSKNIPIVLDLYISTWNDHWTKPPKTRGDKSIQTEVGTCGWKSSKSWWQWVWFQWLVSCLETKSKRRSTVKAWGHTWQWVSSTSVIFKPQVFSVETWHFSCTQSSPTSSPERVPMWQLPELEKTKYQKTLSQSMEWKKTKHGPLLLIYWLNWPNWLNWPLFSS